MGLTSHSLQSTVINAVGGILSSEKNNSVVYVDALNDISLDIKNGDRIGIIGHNGAGKTTLLRVLSGVYPPTKGEIKISGNVSALTDFSMGMDPNASGIKNIIFRLAFMGYTFKSAKSAIDEIVEFSELSQFINLPVRTYSTGMFLRLAFAISTHFTPDILILDEIIGAGDEGFRQKAKKRVDELLNKARIVVMSSHDLGAVKDYCSKAILMDKGRILECGNSDFVIKSYLDKL
jgi:ABC-type polysaccharide/polyol phosphate transport system ATPase subunit